MPDNENNEYLSTYDEIYNQLSLDKEDIGRDTKHSYRVVMYDKISVEFMERRIIKEMLELNPTGPYSTTFLLKASALFPEKFPEFNTKKRGKKSTNYFIEDVGKYLWAKWYSGRAFDDRNDFLTYCYPLIDGVIFKYARHKHGLAYEEIFQSAIIKIIQAMDKFDPARVVGKDDNGNPIYARVYTYFTMVLNYGITTITMAHGAERITNVSYENVSRLCGEEAYSVTDASIIFQEFLLVLETLEESEDELISETNKKVISKLRVLLKSPEFSSKLVHNLLFTLKNECDVKVKDVQDALDLIKTVFGPLIIFSELANLTERKENDGY